MSSSNDVVDGRVVLLENEQNSIVLVVEEQELDAKHFFVVGSVYSSQNKGDVESSSRTEAASHRDCVTSEIPSAEELRLVGDIAPISIRPSKLNLFESKDISWTQIPVFASLRKTMRIFDQSVAMFSLANRSRATLWDLVSL
ncbi:hypothetical protein Y032_0017g3348 [Ancylostoma ceylanicum]|uniref:Uncharacterized protein n=1 Tax=Ancylostoma ceylanicum TaxID=53326 RepID=A0A016V432_9BILA|nr:hypothetical protein Y032_0017g3348 [Ancylostoma ceylanicum]